MASPRFYLMKDDHNENPYGSPLKVKRGEIIDLSGRYHFSKVRLGEATCHRVFLNSSPDSLNPKVRIIYFVLGKEGISAYQSLPEGLQIQIDPITKEQAVQLRKGFESWAKKQARFGRLIDSRQKSLEAIL